ncbi:MAG TPA: hypothetical protein VJB56_00330 [Candidatus Paceibacterota bacterium]
MVVSRTTRVNWALRLGLGVMYLYSGFDIISHPTAWTWAIRQLPVVIQNPIMSIGGGGVTFLTIQGAVEILFALVFLAWFLPRKLVWLVTLLSAFEMGFILLLVGLDAVTFRDIGVLGASIALMFNLGENQ